MLPRPLSLLCFIAALITVDVYAREPHNRLPWSASYYHEQPIPDIWRGDGTIERQTDVAAYQAFTFRDSPPSVKAFIARFGPPSRFLVSKRPDHTRFLVYDLPSGHSVGLYVSEPPDDAFGAAVIFDRRGELIALIK
jgi:hypothetical protein